MELLKKSKEPQRKYIKSLSIDLFPEPKKIVIGTLPDGTEDIEYEDVPSPSLGDIVKYYQNEGINLNDVKVTYGNIYHSYHDTYYSFPRFTYTVWEPEEDYQARLEQYKEDLANYKSWHTTNKEKIKAYKAILREQKQQTAQEQKRLHQIEKAKKEIEKNKKLLEEMGKNDPL